MSTNAPTLSPALKRTLNLALAKNPPTDELVAYLETLCADLVSVDGRVTTLEASPALPTLRGAIQNVDLAALAPHAKSDDFRSLLINPKWQTLNEGGLLTVTHPGDGVVSLDLGTSAPQDFSGIFQPVAGDSKYMISAKVRAVRHNPNFSGMGIFVGEDFTAAPGTAGFFTIYLSNDGRVTVQTFQQWNTSAGFTQPFSGVFSGTVACFRAVVDLDIGKIFGSFSSTGEKDSWAIGGEHTIGGNVTAVASMGLIMKEQNTARIQRGGFSGFEYVPLSDISTDSVQAAMGNLQELV